MASHRKKQSDIDSLNRFWKSHSWTTPLSLLVAVLLATPSPVLRRFVFLSYKDGEDDLYGKGAWDLAFVAFYTLVLSVTRELVMQEILLPLARTWGLRSRRKQQRFMEQAYTVVYFGILGPVGVYVMRSTPVWYFNTRGMYELYPHRMHSAAVKGYYLLQAAYWAQQALVMVLGLERPRRDYAELVGHHLVTLALIALSYRFHFVYIGLAVYLTHDISDFFLAMSKCMLYVNSIAAPPMYLFTLLSWIYLRNYQNLRILVSLVTEFRTVGPYTLDWAAEQYKCGLSNAVTLVLLSALQGLNLFWLAALLRNLYRYVVYRVAKDDRSDDE
ncbi:hypothetical protein ASPZODRAFT_70314 [Penicilliopsis zonata CBS 506.65]|uniref:TLC domain-containing protein n=1 Tax=Penicilliopsis zonata CBS 506.65 TaxID=1073090 RepID=A0A1L9SDC9_9EURO|nr:hypothetical protein ASPZODRAFT_70314 [Penicilliopsis zonata CBS 506.65]OJJ45097.1 hypothetical protein ASPZODRAFT_70314 [Penicilliopsis zonata CBS 506.65]